MPTRKIRWKSCDPLQTSTLNWNHNPKSSSTVVVVVVVG